MKVPLVVVFTVVLLDSPTTDAQAILRPVRTSRQKRDFVQETPKKTTFRDVINDWVNLFNQLSLRLNSNSGVQRTAGSDNRAVIRNDSDTTDSAVPHLETVFHVSSKYPRKVTRNQIASLLRNATIQRKFKESLYNNGRGSFPASGYLKSESLQENKGVIGQYNNVKRSPAIFNAWKQLETSGKLPDFREAESSGSLNKLQSVYRPIEKLGDQDSSNTVGSSQYQNNFVHDQLLNPFESPIGNPYYDIVHNKELLPIPGGYYSQNSIAHYLPESNGLRKLNRSRHKISRVQYGRPNRVSVSATEKFLKQIFNGLTNLPVIGSLFRSSDPSYSPFVRRLNRGFENENGLNEDDRLCFGPLGCLVTTRDFFDPIYRPVNLPPNSRQEIGTYFIYYNRNYPKGLKFSPFSIEEDLPRLPVNLGAPTKIITHGFLDTGLSTWVRDIVQSFLTQGDYNIFSVDWAAGSRVFYSQATSNARLVALEISYLIKLLIQHFGVQPQDIHIVGHSLGAHVAGYVGESIPGIGRITGLDPAEPYFQYFAPSVRLDETDASFVDVIHSDAASIFSFAFGSGFGMKQPVGHVDFYPNGGESQPGCADNIVRLPRIVITRGEDLMDGLDAASESLLACNHFRAVQLFTDSISSDCPYIAYECHSYEAYNRGQCFSCGEDESSCAPLGFRADTWNRQNRSNVMMFLNAREPPNYCLNHYRLELSIADPYGRREIIRGRLKVTLIDEEGILKEFNLTPRSSVALRRGTTQSFILEHHDDLSDTREALIYWELEIGVFDPMIFCVINCRIDLTVAALTLVSYEVAEKARRSDASGVLSPITMCHKMGDDFVSIKNQETVKISASDTCKEIKSRFDAQSVPVS